MSAGGVAPDPVATASELEMVGCAGLVRMLDGASVHTSTAAAAVVSGANHAIRDRRNQRCAAAGGSVRTSAASSI